MHVGEASLYSVPYGKLCLCLDEKDNFTYATESGLTPTDEEYVSAIIRDDDDISSVMVHHRFG